MTSSVKLMLDTEIDSFTVTFTDALALAYSTANKIDAGFQGCGEDCNSSEILVVY